MKGSFYVATVNFQIYSASQDNAKEDIVNFLNGRGLVFSVENVVPNSCTAVNPEYPEFKCDKIASHDIGDPIHEHAIGKSTIVTWTD